MMSHLLRLSFKNSGCHDRHMLVRAVNAALHVSTIAGGPLVNSGQATSPCHGREEAVFVWGVDVRYNVQALLLAGFNDAIQTRSRHNICD